MKPTLKLLVVVLAVAAQGCVPDQSIQIEAAYAELDANCVVTGGSAEQRLGGSINVGWTPSYFMVLRLQSALESSTISTGGLPDNPPARNDAYLHEIEVSYTCKDTSQRCSGFPKFGPVVKQISGTVVAGGVLDAGLNIMSYDFQQKLVSYSPIVSGQDVTILVGIKFRGALASGASFETATYTFPLTTFAFGAPPVCPSPGVLASASGGDPPPCSNWGQDGVYSVCNAAAP